MSLHRRQGHCITVGEPENTMKHRKGLLSVEELIVTKDKVRKVSKRASETREQTLHRQEQNRRHLACAESSALQCCSLHSLACISRLLHTNLCNNIYQLSYTKCVGSSL